MKLLRTPEGMPAVDPALLSLTVGNFDGFHRGHAAVIEELVVRARGLGATPVAVTFEPHPMAVVAPEHAPGLLTTTEEKAELMSPSGLAALLVVEFTPDVMNEDAREFLAWLRVGHGSHLVLGYDFHMGKGRCCDIGRLSELGAEIGYGLDVVPPVEHDGRPISSTRVRASVTAGDVEEAAAMLGRPYSLRGKVVGGDKAGRRLRSPTANLDLPEGTLLPGDGVYLVSASSLEGRPAALYVGTRPTFGSGERRAEVHVLDLEADLYGEILAVDLVERIRGDEAFGSAEELAARIGEDLDRVRGRAAARGM